MELKPGKIYYSMGEVAEMFDVNQSLIRFWEQRFDVLKPKKNKKGNRLFTPDDLKNLEIIYHLVKERGMTLAGAEKYMRANKVSVERDTEIVRRLQEIRSTLLAIKGELREDGGKAVFTAPGYEEPSGEEPTLPDAEKLARKFPPVPETQSEADGAMLPQGNITVGQESPEAAAYTFEEQPLDPCAAPEAEPDFEPEYSHDSEFEPEPLFIEEEPDENAEIPDEELLADNAEPELEQEKEEISAPFVAQELFPEETFSEPGREEKKPDVFQQSLF